jgi:aspartate racemase
MKFSKAIGIVGGAGAVAGGYLFSMILEVCQKKYGAKDYGDFPEIILVSYPFTRGDKLRIQEEISLCVKKLQKAGACLCCVASHSFHGFLPEIKLPFVNLVDEAMKAAHRMNIGNALLFAAETTIDLKIYEKGNFKCIYPSNDEQQVVNRIIREVAGGSVRKEQAEELKQIIGRYDVDGIILACTEYPLIHRSFHVSELMPVIDPIEILAEKLVASAI